MCNHKWLGGLSLELSLSPDLQRGTFLKPGWLSELFEALVNTLSFQHTSNLLNQIKTKQNPPFD